jgi:hypothetical protein
MFRSGATHDVALVQENQVGGVRRLEAQALFPGLGAADHRDFVEGDLRFRSEIRAEAAHPSLNSESRIVGEAERQQGHAT